MSMLNDERQLLAEIKEAAETFYNLMWIGNEEDEQQILDFRLIMSMKAHRHIGADEFVVFMFENDILTEAGFIPKDVDTVVSGILKKMMTVD